MVGPVEPDHLEGKGLCPIIGWIPEVMGRSICPSGTAYFLGMMPWKRHPSRLDARSVDAHGIERLNIHDVEAAASIHQHLGELLRADDQVDHERRSSQLWDAFRVVYLIKGYGGL